MRRKQFLNTDYPTEIIFGEAKSFGKDAFKDEDIKKAKLLAEAFPGSILVFATMKEAEELSRDEVIRLQKLVKWGREYDKERSQTRAPVIILTGTELFTPYSLEQSWKDKGGIRAQLIAPAYMSVRLDNLRLLANLTQQVYLKMPSYEHWRDEKWKKRRGRKMKAQKVA